MNLVKIVLCNAEGMLTGNTAGRSTAVEVATIIVLLDEDAVLADTGECDIVV